MMMVPHLEELIAVLAGFGEASAPAVTRARRLAMSPGAAISRSEIPVPSRNLQRIYAVRAGNPESSAAMRARYAALAATAAQFADESWHIYTVTCGGDEVAVFARAAGAGRFVLDLGAS